MINEKETLKKFHKIKPELTIEELLSLLDGIVEKNDYLKRDDYLTRDIYQPCNKEYKDKKFWDNIAFGDAKTSIK